MKKIRNCFFWLICIIVISGCSSKIDKQIELLFEKTHEEDIRQALSDRMHRFTLGKEDYFVRDENNYIVYSPDYLKIIDNIENLHKEFHLSDKIPRNSNDWVTLLYYYKNPKRNKSHLITECPYCRAEADGELKIDEIDWSKTILSPNSYIKDSLLEFMKNDEMKKILADFQEYLKTEECFSDKETKNWLFYRTINGNKYYVNGTIKYNDYISKIINFHKKYHKYDWNGKVAATLFSRKEENLSWNKFFFSAIEGGTISSCPICLLIYQRVYSHGSDISNIDIEYSSSDFYIFQENGFGDVLFKQYYTRKEDEKKNSSMPLYSMTTIDEEIRSNKIAARKKFDGQQIKVKGKILCVDDDKIELWEGGPYIFLKESELEKLKADQYITFIAKMKLFDTSSNQSSSTSWFDEVDSAFSDLDTLSEDLKNGGVGYSFENCQIISQ